jgi:hypothetical protein
MESENYRGYHIVTEPNGRDGEFGHTLNRQTCRFTSHVSFHVDADSSEEALDQAKQKIDGLLLLT